jgi:hypothetical protein
MKVIGIILIILGLIGFIFAGIAFGDIGLSFGFTSVCAIFGGIGLIKGAKHDRKL